MFHAGKQNVNEEHSNEPNRDFDIVIRGHVGLPTAATIALGGPSGIKNLDDSFKFDQDRTLVTNPERYQGTLVELLDVSLADAAGWGNDATLTLIDAGGLTIPLKLGLSGFDAMPAPVGTFDVVGILDQEGSNTGDYRLWVTDPSWFSADVQSVPEPAGLALAAAGAVVLMAFGERKRRRRGA